MMTTDAPKASEWLMEYRRLNETTRSLVFPSETLVRLFKGDYIPGMPKAYEKMRVCDVSCGTGNNTFFLHDLGLDAYATEIHKDICADVQRSAQLSGRKIDVRVGTNCQLPFEDNFFDFLVSWNVLHYETTEENIGRGITEYARVLKPGGRLILSTTGPGHKILAAAHTVGPHLYEIERNDDFRKGERFFYFDAPNYLHYYFAPSFGAIMVGRIQDHLFTETLDWWLVTGRKPL
jgi:SAM-dependent methyltransferase